MRVRRQTYALDDRDRWQAALVRDAGWASLTGALYSGVILVGLALAMDAGSFVIGLLGAVPFIAQTAQLPAIVLIEHLRRRKVVAIGAVSFARTLILALALIPFLPDGNTRLVLLIAAQLAISVLNSVTGCAVNSWMHQLLPPEGLGAFFSRKLFWATTMACAGTFVAGLIVDHWPFDGKVHAYSVSFGAAAIAGFISAWYLSRVPEPPMTNAGPGVSIVEKILTPFRDARFRRVLIYLAAWNAASNIAAPFIAVFLIRHVGLSFGTVTKLWAAPVGRRALGVVIEHQRFRAHRAHAPGIPARHLGTAGRLRDARALAHRRRPQDQRARGHPAVRARGPAYAQSGVVDCGAARKLLQLRTALRAPAAGATAGEAMSPRGQGARDRTYAKKPST